MSDISNINSKEQGNVMSKIYQLTYTNSYVENFNKLVKQQVDLLSFASKEEYLEWVSDWKKAYKDNSLLRRYQKINWRWNESHCTNVQLRAQLDKMGPSYLAIRNYPEKIERLNRWKARFVKDGYAGYGSTPNHDLSWDTLYMAHYLLVVRKAGKIRAQMDWLAKRDSMVGSTT